MADTDDPIVDASPAPADPVPALIAAGDHIGAAQAAVNRGELRRAIALYEKAWRFSDALALAQSLGDRPLAIRLALDGGQPEVAVRLAEEIPRDAAAELRAAALAFAARGDNWEAARMAERSGDATLAASHFRRAGSLIDVGRMEELAGRPHQAGIAYERALADAATAETTGAAHLALGRLLARLGRHQDAARSLQRAMQVPALRLAAGRALTAELIALGLRVAAAEIVSRLRRESPDLPDSAEEIAALDAVDVAASASAVGQVGAEPGLLRRRFKVLRSLGAGATSQVYLAEDVLLGHPVALKLLSVGAGARGAEQQAYLRFAREAEAAGRLRHPNIVALYDSDPAMGLFVLEMMPGGTLADRLAEKGPLSPGAARRLALDLLSALSAAHDAGIVHRDLKPANVLFDAVGNAKLGDFGAAHLVDFGQTQTGGLLGTVAYMSPEQISAGAIGPASDIYGLAVTLFEALTGRLPFPGPDIVAQHLGEQAPAPSDCRAGLSAVHDAVLLRALRKAPEERWQSAAHMAAAIRAWPTDTTTATTATAPAGHRPGGQPDGGGSADAAAMETETETETARPPGAEVPDVPDLAVGRTAAGLVFRRDDPHLGRPVLVEIRDQPLDGDALTVVRAMAAAGGPTVQRVLALSEDGRTITYELCEGPVLFPADFAPHPSLDLAAFVAGAEAALAAAGVPPRTPDLPRRFAMTPGGPVLLLLDPTGDPE
ncbi:MAG: serine/threonine-protein kinase [Pseudomonadota bacterium]